MLGDAHFLTIAHIVADAGTCARLKVGAVLVRDRRIISTGYNGTAAGQEHCDHSHGIQPDVGCYDAVHAEVNAIAFAAKHGVVTEGSYLYTTDSPCYDCAKLIVNAGVKEVKYGRKYRLGQGIDLLESSGVLVEELGEPELHLVSVEPGDQSGVHPGQHANQAFDEAWQRRADSRRGGSAGLQ